MTRASRIGLIVNPIAGMGGAVGLKGTDGRETLRQARQLGATPRSPLRASITLGVLTQIRSRVELITCSGLMGEVEASEAGLRYALTPSQHRGVDTTAADTRRAAVEMVGMGVELLLFAGGDGTACDVFHAVSTRIPVVGIPTGVKIHSAVFAVNPVAAGVLATEFVTGRTGDLCEAEVMDIDEEGVRAGVISAKLVGYLAVPQHPVLLQGPKARGLSEREVRASIAQGIVSQMDQETRFVIGPGTTAGAIMDVLGLDHTLLGVDVVCDRRLVASDVSEQRLLELVTDQPAKIVVSPIGGQGYVFGRGNQQISGLVIEAVGIENIIVVASDMKLASLKGRPLRIDLDDDAVSDRLVGFVRVITGEHQAALYRLSS